LITSAFTHRLCLFALSAKVAGEGKQHFTGDDDSRYYNLVSQPRRALRLKRKPLVLGVVAQHQGLPCLLTTERTNAPSLPLGAPVTFNHIA
jgi:hypothetical protein